VKRPQDPILLAMALALAAGLVLLALVMAMYVGPWTPMR
jgi:hypothetical protein